MRKKKHPEADRKIINLLKRILVADGNLIQLKVVYTCPTRILLLP